MVKSIGKNVVPGNKKLQPELKFKPRTDFERIIDSIDIYGKIKSRLVKKINPTKSEHIDGDSFEMEFLEYNAKKDFEQKNHIEGRRLVEFVYFKGKDTDDSENHTTLPNTTTRTTKNLVKPNFSKMALGKELYTNSHWEQKVVQNINAKKILNDHNEKDELYSNARTYFKGVQDFTQNYNDRK